MEGIGDVIKKARQRRPSKACLLLLVGDLGILEEAAEAEEAEASALPAQFPLTSRRFLFWWRRLLDGSLPGRGGYHLSLSPSPAALGSPAEDGDGAPHPRAPPAPRARRGLRSVGPVRRPPAGEELLPVREPGRPCSRRPIGRPAGRARWVAGRLPPFPWAACCW